ncbi:MAG: ABC transporter substrate-binding protein [Roseovarius sp.]
MFRPLFRGLAAAAFAASLTVPAWAQTLTVTDTENRSVEIPEAAERIVLGFYYEDFMAVAGPEGFDRVAAISRAPWEGWRNLQWQTYVKALPQIAELPDVGDTSDGTFSLEAVVSARPDLVLLASWQFGALADLVPRIEAAGIPVVVLDFNAQTVEKHVQSTRLLGRILGQEERAERLAGEYEAAVTDVLDRIAAVPTEARPRVYVELGRKGRDVVDNSYAGTQWGAVIDQLGAENIANGQIESWGPLSPEYVLSRNPQVILLAGSGWMGQDEAVLMGPGIDAALTHERMRPYLERPGWADLAAVRDGQVYGLYHGGNRTLYDYAFLQYLAKALYPETFADLEPQAALDRFFATYMPVQFEGTYMTRLPAGQDG